MNEKLENLSNENYVNRVNDHLNNEYNAEEVVKKQSAVQVAYNFLKDMAGKTKRTLAIGAIMFSAGALYGASHEKQVKDVAESLAGLVGIEYTLNKTQNPLNSNEQIGKSKLEVIENVRR